MPKRRTDPTPPAPSGFELLRLAAVVCEPAPPKFIGQSELADWTGVEERTIQNWAERGLPVDRSRGRPRYPIPDAMVWASEYKRLVAQARRTHRSAAGPAHLSMEQARFGHIQANIAALNLPLWEVAVLVPLEHDHPMRREMLRKAAEGVLPIPLACTCGGKTCPVHRDQKGQDA